jgi:arginine decarboxylase
MKKIAPEEAGQIYGVEHWGAGYFEVHRNGHLIARPGRGDPRWVDLKELVDHLVGQRRLQPPLLLRFPQILGNQLHTLHRAFQEAGRAFGWSAAHYPVFPMKVNPRREVVEELLREGRKVRLGVECGSKAELYAAVGLDQPPESLLVCNGFKDEAFVDLAFLGVQAGKRVVLVVEKLNELKMLVGRLRKREPRPWIGLRAKLYSRGSGKWASSCASTSARRSPTSSGSRTPSRRRPASTRASGNSASRSSTSTSAAAWASTTMARAPPSSRR